jgi:hypothetical protein
MPQYVQQIEMFPGTVRWEGCMDPLGAQLAGAVATHPRVLPSDWASIAMHKNPLIAQACMFNVRAGELAVVVQTFYLLRKVAEQKEEDNG